MAQADDLVRAVEQANAAKAALVRELVDAGIQDASVVTQRISDFIWAVVVLVITQRSMDANSQL